MATDAQQVSVAGTVRLTYAGAGDRDGVVYHACNRGAAIVYLGGSSVSPTTGYQLGPGESFNDSLSPGEEVYATVSAGTVSVHVFESSFGSSR